MNTYQQLAATIDKLQAECKIVKVTKLPSSSKKNRRSAWSK